MARKFSEQSYRKSTGASLDEWCQVLDEFGAREKPRLDIQAYLQDVKGLTKFWATMIIGNYAISRSLGLCRKNRHGKFNLSVSFRANSSPELLFSMAMESVALPQWLLVPNASPLVEGMIINHLHDGTLNVTDIDDVGWIRLERSLDNNLSIVNINFKPTKSSSICLVHITESNIADYRKLPIFRAFWASVVDRILGLA